jgi:flagellar biosynthesis chaperone FliJ
MAQTMGVTAPKLIETAQHYVGILQGEQKKFADAMASRTTNDVTAKEQEIANLDSVIKNKAEQIKQLTEQIQLHQNQMDAMRQQLIGQSNQCRHRKYEKLPQKLGTKTVD